MKVGFVVDRTDSTPSIHRNGSQKSWKQRVSDKIVKRDLILNFRKPQIGRMGDLVIYIATD